MSSGIAASRGENHLEIISSLRKTIAWMDIVMSRLDQGIVVVQGNDMKISYVNQAFSDILGKPRILLFGTPLGNFITEHSGIPIKPQPSSEPGQIRSQKQYLLSTINGFRTVEIEENIIEAASGQRVLVIRDNI